MEYSTIMILAFGNLAFQDNVMCSTNPFLSIVCGRDKLDLNLMSISLQTYTETTSQVGPEIHNCPLKQIFPWNF